MAGLTFSSTLDGYATPVHVNELGAPRKPGYGARGQRYDWRRFERGSEYWPKFLPPWSWN